MQKCSFLFSLSPTSFKRAPGYAYIRKHLENKTVTENKLLHAPFRGRVAKTDEDFVLRGGCFDHVCISIEKAEFSGSLVHFEF